MSKWVVRGDELVKVRAWTPRGIRLAWVCGVLLACAAAAEAAGHYTLAYWREAAAYENQAPPAGELGHVLAAVHVWDESGEPLAGKRIYTSWGVYLGSTDEKGYAQIQLYRPNGYDFEIREDGQQSDTSPILSVERPPSWGHYSFELGFLFKRDTSNPGRFDTSYLGTLNASGTDPCRDLSAPHTRSLAYYSTLATDYCSDFYELGNWTASHGQTFVANGNRIVAMKALMAAGFGVHHYWTAQILEGGPNGVPIGPPRSSRLHLDSEYFSLLVRWGVNDVQVVPGRTYYLKITRDSGINVFRVNRNNYAPGNYFENGVPVASAEMMGMVVCGTFTNAGPSGEIAGVVRDADGLPLAGCHVSIPDLGLYTTTTADGRFSLPSVAVGVYSVQASKAGYVAGIANNVRVTQGQRTETSFALEVDDSTGGGVILTPHYSLQPFEATPEWSSTFDASWGTPANFSLVNTGQEGNGLQSSRGGTGSSVRAQVFPLAPGAAYDVAIWIRCPSSSSDYWVECGYRLGSQTAESFDTGPQAWTLVTKFSDEGANGNGNVWTRYTARFDSGAASQVTVAIKTGASSGTGPAVLWDELSVVSLALPGLVSAVVESPTNVLVRFAESVREDAASSAGNYQLRGQTERLEVLSAARLSESTVWLTTALQTPRVDYVLSVSNVAGLLHVGEAMGRNGEAVVRVPVPLVRLDPTTLWRFYDLGGGLPGLWRSPVFSDAGWSQGAGLFGYGDGVLAEPIRTPLTVDPDRVTTFYRHRFVLPADYDGALLRVRALVDDGALFWLNGVELLRLGLGVGSILPSTPATRQVGLAAYEGPFDLVAPSLQTGTNLCAVEVHQVSSQSSDVVFGASLEALVRPSQVLQELGAVVIGKADLGVGVVLRWSDAGALLQSSTNLAGPWMVVPGASSPHEVQPVETTEYFRLAR